MSVERERQIFEILDEALEQSPRQREAFLDRACGADAEMRREIEALLETEVEDGLLAEPMFSIHADDPGIGRQIGPYKLVRLLDRGGMGSVYLAEREDFEQQVALKLIRRGLDADDLMVRRFENERQILARLDHPNIARLLDGGTTDDRLPYFVMEYVEGVPIDRYCEERSLSVEERLVLFGKVCSAVQFAHQNLVVHRDLKPSNILITSDGQPRLLDFGIAKLLDDSLAASAVQTVTGQAAMTPRYASPEQIQLRPVTTASDVYSLGVLLYELLTGLDPYGVDKRRSDEVARAVCETEPDRPSTAVRRRATEPDDVVTRRLRRQLSGDLDGIVLKAMRKEPNQRYSSAEQLAEDIRRHLEGLPVDAQTATFRYRAGKFVRRHRLGMSVAAAFLIVILGFSISTTVLWQKAVREQERATTISNFLKDLFKAADPDSTSAESTTTRELLNKGKALLTDGSLDEELDLQIIIAGMLGDIFRKMGVYEQSEQMMNWSLEAAREYHKGPHDEVATRLNNLAVLSFENEDYEKAETQFKEVLEMRDLLDQPPKTRFKAQSNLAMTLLRQGKLDQAEKLCSEVLDARQREYEDQSLDKDVASSSHNLAAVYFAQGRHEEAQKLLQPALDTRKFRLGTPHTKVAASLDLLGSILAAQGELETAETYFRDAWEMRNLLSASPRSAARTKKNLAALLAWKDTDYARKLATEALEVFRSNSWDAAETKSVLGLTLVASGAYGEAEPLLIEGYEQMKGLRGAHTYRSQLALQRIIDLFEAWDKPAEARRFRAMLAALK